MILNPFDYQGIRLDRAVDLSPVRVKFPFQIDTVPEQRIILQDIEYPIFDMEFEKLCKKSELAFVHSKDLWAFYQRNPDPGKLPIVTSGSDESGYYFGVRYAVCLELDKNKNPILKAFYHPGNWSKGTRFALASQ